MVVHDRVFIVKAYRDDDCVMLAMDLPQSACDGLAGFAIARGPNAAHLAYIKNRLSFDPSRGAYAFEAIKLVDHYEFRALEQTATQTQPLVLQSAGAATPWWQSSFDVKNIKNTERELFVS